VDLHGEQTVAAVFAAEEIRPLGAAPGLRQRVPEFFVKYKWQEKENESGRYLSEVRSFHTAALAAVGSARLDAPKVLEDDVARWVDTDELAGAEAARVTTSLGAGLILWSFETPYPFPELEVGDLVTVACDWFVASDPVASRELRGQIWATGVVVRQHDPWGRGFDIWIRNYSDLVPASAVVDRDGYAPLPTVTATVTNDGPNATVAVQGSSTAVTLWYQELVAGVWSAEVQFASGQAGSFTLAKSETGVRTLRVYAKNAAAAAGTTQPVELDRYEDPSLSHQPPSVSIRQAQTPAATRKKIWLAFSIALGEGGTSPLSWSVQVDEQRGATGTPSAFSTAAAPIAFEVDRGRYGKVVTLTAKDADGRQSSTRYTVAGTQTSGTEPTAGGRQQYARAGLGGTAAVLHSAVDVRDASGLVTLVDPASSSFANATLQDTVSDPRGRTVGAALVKPGGVGAPDTADSIGDGLTRRVTTHNEATGGGRGYAGFKNGSGGLVATATVDDGKGDRPVENVRASGRRATRRGAQQLGGHAADTRRGGIGGVPGQTRVSAPIRDTSGLMTLVDPATATFANGTLQDTVQDARGRVVGAALVKSGGVAATDTADSIGDGLTKRVTSNSEATGGARAYTALDSNSRLTDARRANMALTAGRGSTQYNYGATLLSVTRDSGTLVTVTVAAHTLRVSGIDINYNSGSCVFSSLTATSNNGKPFYVYASDPLYSGGAVTYLASLNKEDVQGASGYYFVGQGTVPAASGSGSGGGGGGMV
jgi:hypothetical protein